ncbi:hypothetical protein [Amycolatopsis sp. 3B14]|uniref:hypothetical protein n=1 Tax=Amycolatopsis sp. 3B14 TaxID=3243600 RepID=UPI003D9656D5
MAKKDSAVAEDLRFQFDDPQVRHNGLVLESEVDGAGPVKFAARPPARRSSVQGAAYVESTFSTGSLRASPSSPWR